MRAAARHAQLLIADPEFAVISDQAYLARQSQHNRRDEPCPVHHQGIAGKLAQVDAQLLVALDQAEHLLLQIDGVIRGAVFSALARKGRVGLQRELKPNRSIVLWCLGLTGDRKKQEG